MKTTKNKILFTSILIIFITSIFLYKNIPLRTAIYRKFAKQTVYIISEVDTIYSFGYFGVRKQGQGRAGKKCRTSKQRRSSELTRAAALRLGL